MNKVIILVGCPGSGKSTYCSNYYGSHVRINQDSLGDRGKCELVAEACLKSGVGVVIDRTNINKEQRAIWIKLAKKYNFKCICVYFDTPVEVCMQRVLTRKNHETIPLSMPEAKKLEIVEKFARSLEIPLLSEQIDDIIVIK